ncbi:MAG TPA: hypothetical protein DEF47_18585 [Herpetosiphon sp.]|nr:hypothetical protein [Herpetosiphon sp.]
MRQGFRQSACLRRHAELRHWPNPIHMHSPFGDRHLTKLWISH